MFGAAWNALKEQLDFSDGWLSSIFHGDGTMSETAKGLSDFYLHTNYQAQDAATTQFERQQILDQQDRQWQEYMQDKMNAYNTPAAMMARYRAAGLNPSLMYGQPVSEAANPPGTASSSAGMSGSGRGSGNALQDLLNMRMAKSQIALTDAQIKDVDASARLKDEQAKSEADMRQSRIDNLNAATKNLEKQNEGIVAEVKRKAKENELTDAQIGKIKFDRMMEGKKFMLDKKRLENETGLTAAQIEKLYAEEKELLAKAKVTNREYDEMVWTYAIRSLGLERQVELTEAQTKQAEATARKLGLDADLISGRAMYESVLAGEVASELAKGHGTTLAMYRLQHSINVLGGLVHAN